MVQDIKKHFSAHDRVMFLVGAEMSVRHSGTSTGMSRQFSTCAQVSY